MDHRDLARKLAFDPVPPEKRAAFFYRFMAKESSDSTVKKWTAQAEAGRTLARRPQERPSRHATASQPIGIQTPGGKMFHSPEMIGYMMAHGAFGKTAQYRGDGLSEIVRDGRVTDELVGDTHEQDMARAGQLLSDQEAELEQHRQQIAAERMSAQQAQEQAQQMIQGLQQQVQQLGQQAQSAGQVMAQARQMQAQLGAQLGEATQAALQSGQEAIGSKMLAFRTQQEFQQLEQGVENYKQTLRAAIENDPVQQRMQQQAAEQQQLQMMAAQAQQGMMGGQPGQQDQGQQQQQPAAADANKMAALRQLQLHDRDVVQKLAVKMPGPSAIRRGVRVFSASIKDHPVPWIAAGAGLVAAGAVGTHMAHKMLARRQGNKDVMPGPTLAARNAPFIKARAPNPKRNAPSTPALPRYSSPGLSDADKIARGIDLGLMGATATIGLL